jgi:hypothetical protein
VSPRASPGRTTATSSCGHTSSSAADRVGLGQPTHSPHATDEGFHRRE